jgi:hypothetical protein
MDELDLTGICRVSHPTAADYIFISTVSGNFSKIYYILGHKTNLKYQKN